MSISGPAVTQPVSVIRRVGINLVRRPDCSVGDLDAEDLISRVSKVMTRDDPKRQPFRNEQRPPVESKKATSGTRIPSVMSPFFIIDSRSEARTTTTFPPKNAITNILCTVEKSSLLNRITPDNANPSATLYQCLGLITP